MKYGVDNWENESGLIQSCNEVKHYETAKDYEKIMGSCSEYGTDYEVGVFNRIYEVPITIYCRGVDNVIRKMADLGELKGQAPLLLLFSRNSKCGHWEVIRKQYHECEEQLDIMNETMKCENSSADQGLIDVSENKNSSAESTGKPFYTMKKSTCKKIPVFEELELETISDSFDSMKISDTEECSSKNIVKKIDSQSNNLEKEGVKVKEMVYNKKFEEKNKGKMKADEYTFEADSDPTRNKKRVTINKPHFKKMEINRNSFTIVVVAAAVSVKILIQNMNRHLKTVIGSRSCPNIQQKKENRNIMRDLVTFRLSVRC